MKTRERAHLRLEARLLEHARRVAKRRGLTFTALVEEGLRQVLKQDETERLAARTVEAEQI